MTYAEARDFIVQANQYGCVPGLDTIVELMKRLGNPQDKLKIIHVAGTNGKGSTSSFITSILVMEGYKVGRYISPVVFTELELIQVIKKKETNKKEVNKKDVPHLEISNITEEGYCASIKLIKTACDQMMKEGYAHPTSFEIETAMTFLYLYWEKVDFVVLEVGLGGRLDATNVIKHPVCSVITSISMDHMNVLGDTLEKIATEKAGIIKEGIPVISTEQKTEAMNVLIQTAEKLEAPIHIAKLDKVKEIQYLISGTSFKIQEDNQSIETYTLQMLGEFQVENGILALETAKKLNEIGYPISKEAMKLGLKEARWQGRFEVIASKPYVVIDGAHNEEAAKSLRNSIQLYFTNRRIIYIIGVLADKDYKTILEITAPFAERILTITPNNRRALSSARLAEEARAFCNAVIDADHINNAISLAYEDIKEEDVIIAFGSLSFLGDLVQGLRTRKDD